MTWRILFHDCTLAQVKDEEGWIPLHYAAYYGYIDIVKELLDNDKSAAYIKTGNEKKTDNEEKTALHIAASRGNVDIMKKFISRCPGCSELVDERGWNVLHFAIESRNPEAIKVVLENPLLGNLINEYNGDGNTPLHQLAALGFYMPSFIGHPKVNKQAVNKQHLNALDITSRKGLFSKEKRYIMHFLKDNGITEGPRLKFDIYGRNGEEKGPSSNDREGNGSSSDDGKGKNKHDNNIANSVQEARQAHLVVAALIATVTFAAGVTVPGGYKNEGSPDQGTAILTRSAAFKAFIITDTIAMTLSSSAVLLHLFMAQDGDKEKTIILLNHELGFTIYALYSMVVAFITGTYAVLASSSAFAVVTSVVGCIFYVIYGHAAFLQMLTFDGDLFLVNIKSMIPQISKAELDRVKREQIKRMSSQIFPSI